MKYPLVQCDLCGIESYSDEKFTEIKEGYNLVGSPKYEDICPSCTIWLIKIMDEYRVNKK
jgi:hypothetical protein